MPGSSTPIAAIFGLIGISISTRSRCDVFSLSASTISKPVEWCQRKGLSEVIKGSSGGEIRNLQDNLLNFSASKGNKRFNPNGAKIRAFWDQFCEGVCGLPGWNP